MWHGYVLKTMDIYLLKNYISYSPEKMWQPYGTLNLKEEIPQYISNYLLKNTETDMEQNSKLEKYIKILEANKNIILTGAPGTGKHI